MEDVILKANLDDSTCLYVSPISRQTYEQHVGENNLGGDRGYFVMKSRKTGERRLDILAKAPTVEAAIDLFDLIVGSRRVHEGV